MEFSVFVEPSGSGFRATTGNPLGLTAEGPTADAALEAVRAQFAERVKAGGQLRSLFVTDVKGILTAARNLKENPMFEEFQASIQEYRRIHNTVPDHDAFDDLEEVA